MRRRLPCLHRRGNIFYHFLKDETGKRCEKSLHTKDADVAWERYQQHMQEVRAGSAPNTQASWNLATAAAEFLSYRKLRVAKGTRSAERSILKNLEGVFGADTKLEVIADIQQVQRYQN